MDNNHLPGPVRLYYYEIVFLDNFGSLNILCVILIQICPLPFFIVFVLFTFSTFILNLSSLFYYDVAPAQVRFCILIQPENLCFF